MRKVRRAARDGEPPQHRRTGRSSSRTRDRDPRQKRFKRILRALPASPRCGVCCGAPFAGFGAHLVRPLGHTARRARTRASAPPVSRSRRQVGCHCDTGVLFADLPRLRRAPWNATIPHELCAPCCGASTAAAEDVLLPEALIDKLIGDEVMALYLPYGRLERGRRMMLGSTRRLLPRSATRCAAPSPRSASASTTVRPSSAMSEEDVLPTSPRSGMS